MPAITLPRITGNSKTDFQIVAGRFRGLAVLPRERSVPHFGSSGVFYRDSGTVFSERRNLEHRVKRKFTDLLPRLLRFSTRHDRFDRCGSTVSVKNNPPGSHFAHFILNIENGRLPRYTAKLATCTVSQTGFDMSRTLLVNAIDLNCSLKTDFT